MKSLALKKALSLLAAEGQRFLVFQFGQQHSNEYQRQQRASSRLVYEGVSLAGAAFGSAIPGTYNSDYTYLMTTEVDYFAGKGMNIIRLPFRWERLQQSLGGDLNAAELARMDAVVAETTAKKVYIILDPHNYARYKSNGYVFFALMNEPYDIDINSWLDAANAAIAGIRAQGAADLILVPGISWTSAHSWLTSGNSTTMVNVKDSGNNFAFEVHQYFDSDSSGSSDTCSTNTGSTRLSDFTNWLKTNNFTTDAAQMSWLTPYL